jgi:hypothetical protein
VSAATGELEGWYSKATAALTLATAVSAATAEAEGLLWDNNNNSNNRDFIIPWFKKAES